MSDNVLSLNKHKENVYSFKITTEGISTDALSVYFYINTPDMRLMFTCIKSDGDEYICTIPILDFIKKTAYSCGLFVQTNDGYFFEPFKGSINITSGVTVTGQPGANITKAIKNAITATTQTVEPTDVKSSIEPTAVSDFNIDKFLSKIDKQASKINKLEDKVEKQEEKIEKQEENPDNSNSASDPKKDVKETVANKNEKSVSAILTELGITVNKSKRQIQEGVRMPASIKSKLK